MRFISLGGKKEGKRTFVNCSFDARSMMGGGGGRKDEGSDANGRVPISNDFIMVLPRVIGDFVSTIGGNTMDVCRS